jgi:hypothetical protein
MDFMQSIVNYFTSISTSSYIAVAGCIVSLASLLYAIYTRNERRKEKKYKELGCKIYSTNILNEDNIAFEKL